MRFYLYNNRYKTYNISLDLIRYEHTKNIFSGKIYFSNLFLIIFFKQINERKIDKN